jgi:TolB protein
VTQRFDPSGGFRIRRGSGGSGRGWLIALVGVVLLAAASRDGGLPAGRIVYAALEADTFDLYVLDLSGGPDPSGESVRLLYASPGDDIEPEWSPDGTRIVFSSNQDGDSDVYLINADGSNPRNLTDNFVTDAGPIFSQACRGVRGACTDWIAFHSDLDGAFNLYMMDDQGGHVTQLTATNANDWWPAWSPDGKRIAFMSDRDTGDTFDIYVLDVGSGVVRRYTDTLFADEVWPAWSPDGRYIAFISDRTGWYHLYLMDADCEPECGSGQRLVTGDDPAQDFDPNWSPDGGWLTFSSHRDPQAVDGVQFDYEIFAIRPDGRDLTQLTFNYAVDDFTPAWTR